MKTEVELDCGANLNVQYHKWGCLVYVDVTGLTPGGISVDHLRPTEATLRISVLNLPDIKKLIDGLLKDPNVKARIKEMKKSGDH